MNSTIFTVKVGLLWTEHKFFSLRDTGLVQNLWGKLYRFTKVLYTNEGQCTSSEFHCCCWNHLCVISLILKKNKSETCAH